MWLQLVVGLITIVTFLIQRMKDNKAFDDAAAELVAKQLKAALDEVKIAEEVRADVRAEHAADPERVRAPDAFSRD